MRWLRSTRPAAEEPAGAPRFLLAQVSDIHLKAGGAISHRVVDTTASLARCVARLAQLPQPPDAVIFTGDLTDAAREDEYDALGRLLKPLAMPVYLMPGNHDDPDLMRKMFASHAYMRQREGRLDYVIDDFPVRIVALDSTLPGQAGGKLHLEQLEWLDELLAERSGKPTIVALHHPPFATGIGHMDAMGLVHPEWLEGVISRHPQVERVISGHVHRAIVKRFAGTVASTCPSPSHQVALDLDDRAEPRFVMEPPGFQLHLWQRGAGLVSHTAALGDHGGPHPFKEDETPA